MEILSKRFFGSTSYLKIIHTNSYVIDKTRINITYLLIIKIIYLLPNLFVVGLAEVLILPLAPPLAPEQLAICL